MGLQAFHNYYLTFTTPKDLLGALFTIYSPLENLINIPYYL